MTMCGLFAVGQEEESNPHRLGRWDTGRNTPLPDQFMKAKTIDEVCGSPPGTFRKFVEKQESELREMERERKERIAKSRKK